MGEALHTRSRVDIRPWPHETSIAHLILLDVDMVPSISDIDRWIDESYELAPQVRSIRTGALFPNAADAFAERGFTVCDRLALLERRLPPTEVVPAPKPATPQLSTRRLRQRDLEIAARIDGDAFPASWQNDAQSLSDIINATPRARARIATLARRPIGFALTGKAGPTGYLQRFAVDADARRLGVAGLLVDDAVRWLSRRGATLALVNTGVDNAAALALYEGRGFRRRSDELVVMEYVR